MAIKKALLIFILLFLFSFYFQKKSKLFLIKPLDGIKELASKPAFDVNGYFEGTYQEKYNKYINENIGFRPVLIRLVNQIDYDIFHTTNAPGVVLGKDGQM